MTSNDNTAAQTFLFPIQNRETDSTMSDSELIEQYRLAFAGFANAVTTGQVTCEVIKENSRNHIRNANDVLVKNGYKPFPIDF